MTPVEQILRDEIAAKGAIGVDRFMAVCLSHPEHGYYMTRDPLGREGDFTTAPEISQIFGELVGLWLAQSWIDMGRPAPVSLLELGPGRGTLMADILRVARAVPDFREAITPNLIEISPVLKAAQQSRLKDQGAVWIESLSDLDPNPVLVVANEFFDAMPIRQFQKVGDVWLERVVRLKKDQLAFGLQKTEITGFDPVLPDGSITERAFAGQSLMGEICKLLQKQGGAALIFDYGDAQGSGDTLQALRDHEVADVFSAPGESDLTAHVNFGDLARSIGETTAYLTTQAQFLGAMGIAERAEALAAETSEDVKTAIKAACHRLTDPSEMGTLFKAMAITTKGAAKPPGF